MQLALVPTAAPFFQNCDLLVAADCVAFAYADFHRKFLKGRILLVGCPKLDNVTAYTEKLTQIFSINEIRSVTVVRMEVPCCGGLTQAVRTAIAASGCVVPYAEAVVGVEGDLLPPREPSRTF